MCPSGRSWTGLILLCGSATALALSPLVLDSSYSVLANTTSESGAQGVSGAWLARLGFLLFGLGVLTIAGRSSARWGQPTTALHAVFGACMIAVAAFSLRSWVPDAQFDTTEDFLHSVAATVMGFAFTFGVLALAIRRARMDERMRLLDVAAIGAATVFPILMGIYGELDGLFQRAMFAVAYVWFAREGLTVPSLEPHNREVVR